MRESKLAGYSPIRTIPTGITPTSNTSNAGNTGNTSNSGNSGNADRKKLTVYIDEQLLGRAKAAYLHEALTNPGSFSAWITRQIENAVTTAEKVHNNGEHFTPPNGNLPTGPRN